MYRLRKRWTGKVIAFALAFAMIFGSVNMSAVDNETQAAEVMKAVWVSYVEVQNLLQDCSKSEFETEFGKICDNAKANFCNTLMVHVRAFEDAVYPSSYFPWSTLISSNGTNPGYDPLALMVQIAHSKGLKFHAWINPYRISGTTDKTAKLLDDIYSVKSVQSKFDEWWDLGIVTQKTLSGGQEGLVLNPNSEVARQLIIDGVKEIVSNYSVDGVVFDDYFYNWGFSDGNNAASEIAARKSYVNMLVKGVYTAIKSINSSVQFGISPQGNLENARNQGCDIDTWLSQSGYIDYISPQIYWTDTYVTNGNSVTMYSNRLNSWVAINKNKTPMYPSLAVYRAGVASSVDQGWSQKTTNLSEQWALARAKGCNGYILYSYTYMLTSAGQAEMNNLNGHSGMVSYATHVQTYGWQGAVCDGETAGTTGQAKRLEAITIQMPNVAYTGSIVYRTHMQSYGWMDWKQDGQISGVTGQSKRMEAIQIYLTGDVNKYYDVYYRVHAQTYGWLDWAKNGEIAGTTGLSKRLEAIEIKLVKKGSDAPGATAHTYVEPNIAYNTHVQTYGWQGVVYNGATAGTSGQAKRLEAITISLPNQKYSGGIEYRVHCQTYSWMDWVSNGAMAGTSGQAKRLEAIEIRLTGEMAEHYDVYYRVHCQTYGWMDWVSNGETAGTTGQAKRLEAIEIKLVEK